jgi:hypothetical protein
MNILAHQWFFFYIIGFLFFTCAIKERHQSSPFAASINLMIGFFFFILSIMGSIVIIIKNP